MVDVMHYKVIKKEDVSGENLIAYLFESDGGRWFSAVRAPDDIDLQVGDELTHYTLNHWKTARGETIMISPDLKCSTREEAELKFEKLRIKTP